MAESNSKRQNAAQEQEDRISSLPDCILSHIMSFLPTKSSVETSILSRRWCNVWKDVSVLDFSDESFEFDKFDDDDIDQDDMDQDDMDQRFKLFLTFCLFVNGMFSSLNKPYQIRKMRLSCTKSLVDNKFCRCSIDTWVRSIIGPDLKELDLILDDIAFSLGGDIYIPQFTKVVHCLPSLKKLKLPGMKMAEMNAFLVGCPILENLNTYLYYEDYANICFPPTLKSLQIDVDIASVGAFLYDNPPCPHYLNLTKIRFGDVSNLQNVMRASLDVFPSSSDHSLAFKCLFKLLNALSGIKHLSLGCSTTKWLLGDPADLHFPEFCHLIHLELILPWFNSNFLLSLLQTCNLLQVLIIQNDQEESPLSGWATQPSVPNCIISHLTFIQFKGYQGLPDELLFVEYILKKGLVLKTMIIDDISLDLSKKCDILNKLYKVLRDGIRQLIFD